MVMDKLLNFVKTNKEVTIVIVAITTLFGAKKIMDSLQGQDIDLQIEEDKSTSKKMAGIKNYGNTCFINSLIQALASMGSFESYLKQLLEDDNPRLPQYLTVSRLLTTIEQINASQGVIEISEFLGALNAVSPQLCNYQQQDSHEFYKVLVECLEKCQRQQLKLSLTSSARVVEDLESPLVGYTQSCLECTKCMKKLKIKVEVFYDLSFDVAQRTTNTLQRAFDIYQMLERLEGVNCVYCSINKYVAQKASTLKKAQQKGLNPVLIRSLENLIKYVKEIPVIDRQIEEINPIINDYVDQQSQALVPILQQLEKDKLNSKLIKDFLAPVEIVKTDMNRRIQVSKLPKILVIHLKRLIMDPYSGALALLRKHIFFPPQLKFTIKDGSQKNFTLTSLLSHSGNESMGHYYTFRKQGKDSDNWFYTSDKTVERCSWRYVSQQTAYMLFYEQ